MYRRKKYVVLIIHRPMRLAMELKPSPEASSYAVTQELLNISRKPKFYYRVQKSLPLTPVLSQNNAVNTIPSYLSKIHLIIIPPPASWSS
jgi:hypothetical protein